MTQRNIHGDWNIRFENRVMYSQVIGSTNNEMSLAMYKDIKRLMLSEENRIDIPWAALTDAREWNLATPDSWEASNDVITWMAENNCIFIAILVSKKVQKFASNDGFFDSNNIIRSFFDYDEANQACLDKLEEIRLQQKN